MKGTVGVVRPRLGSEASVAVGSLGSQACIYLFSLLAARSFVEPAKYGELQTLLAVSAIMSIPAMALQSWAARSIAQGQPTRTILTTTAITSFATAVATTGVLLALGPFLNTSVVPAALSTGLFMVPLVWYLTVQGCLQGAQHQHALAVTLFLGGFARLAGGYVGLGLKIGPWAVVWGIGLVTLLVVGMAWPLVAKPDVSGERKPVLRPMLRIAMATGAIWFLGSEDIVLARLLLSSHDSGLYAAGSMVTRVVQYAPQFVSLASFAALTQAERSLHVLVRGCLKVLAVGGVLTVLTAFFGGYAIQRAFGDTFAGVDQWATAFAVLGTLLAMNQLLVAQRVARHDEGVALGVWAAALLPCVAAPLLGVQHVEGLLTVCIVGNVALVVGLLHRAVTRR